MTQTTGEIIATLRAKGLPATPGKARHAISTGKIPSPPMDGAGNLAWSEEHVAAFRSYLQDPPKPGKRRRPRLASA